MLDRIRLKDKTLAERIFAKFATSLWDSPSTVINRVAGYIRQLVDDEIYDNQEFQTGPAGRPFCWESCKMFLAIHLRNRRSFVLSEDLMVALDKKASLELRCSYLFNKVSQHETIEILLPHTMRKVHPPVKTRDGVIESYEQSAVITFFKDEVNKAMLVQFVFPQMDIHTDLPIFSGWGEIKEHPAYRGGALAMPGDTDEDIFQLMRQPIDGDPDQYANDQILQLALKALLYIKSDGQPDLREVPAAKPIETKKDKKARQQISEANLFPIVRVGFGFAKQNIYVKGQWLQEGHFRWQPFGSREAPMYKLIWIDEMLKQRRQGAVFDTGEKASEKSRGSPKGRGIEQ